MKIHPFLATLCLAAPLCLAEPADVCADYEEDYGEDYEEPSERAYTPEEQAAALQKFAELLRAMNTTLMGVKDRATADAAASLYSEHENNIMKDDVLLALRGVDPEDVIGLLKQRRELVSTLNYAYYYGSVALAEAVTGDADDALEPQPLTPEVQAALVKGEAEDDDTTRVVFALSEDGELTGEDEGEPTLTGGPGFSRETAWVDSAKDSDSSLFYGAHLLRDKYTDFSATVGMKQVVEADKVYYVYAVDFVKDGVKYRGDVWVDVTVGCKIYTPEQQKAALDRVVAIARESADIIRGVQDKASADAAAERLTELRAGLDEETRDILESIDYEIFIEAVREVVPSDEEMETHRKRLDDNDCYGSEKLMDKLRSL